QFVSYLGYRQEQRCRGCRLSQPGLALRMHVEFLATLSVFGDPRVRSRGTCWPLSEPAGSLPSAGNTSWRGGHRRQRPPLSAARPRSQTAVRLLDCRSSTPIVGSLPAVL